MGWGVTRGEILAVAHEYSKPKSSGIWAIFPKNVLPKILFNLSYSTVKDVADDDWLLNCNSSTPWLAINLETTAEIPLPLDLQYSGATADISPLVTLHLNFTFQIQH